MIILVEPLLSTHSPTINKFLAELQIIFLEVFFEVSLEAFFEVSLEYFLLFLQKIKSYYKDKIILQK